MNDFFTSADFALIRALMQNDSSVTERVRCHYLIIGIAVASWLLGFTPLASLHATLDRLDETMRGCRDGQARSEN